MGIFQAGTGFCHRVMVREKDTYLLPCLLKTDLQGWLHSTLKALHYAGVYFLCGTGEIYTLQVKDPESAELYRKYGRKPKGFLGLFGGGEEDGTMTFSLSGEGECLRSLLALEKRENRQAFVLRKETAEALQKAQPAQWQEFLAAGEKSQSILVQVLQVEEAAGEENTLVLDASDPQQRLLLAKRYFLTTRTDWLWQEQDVKELAEALADDRQNPDRRLDVLLEQHEFGMR